jgi:hypothetical protein
MKKLRADLRQGMLALIRCKILPAVLYGCETWSLTPWKERRLMVFDNRVLRRIFGAERDEVKREWRKLHNQELYDVYSSPNIIWVRMRWTGHVGRMGKRGLQGFGGEA